MSDLVIRPEQKLIEAWEVTYERYPWSSRNPLHTRARLNIPHHTIVGTSGEGATVEAARIDVLIKMAAGYISAEEMHDENEIRDETLKEIVRLGHRELRRRRRVLKESANGSGTAS